MKLRDWILPGLVALLLAVGVAVLQGVPGYMDAEYYTAGGLRIASNHWGSEPFLWNYLDDPTGLPHPSFSYWMPLASILAAAGMKLTGSTSFWAGRLFFILLTTLIPAATSWLALRLEGTVRQARLAGWFGVFSGFYLLYTGLTETFTPSMLLGAGIFLVLGADWALWKRALAAGVLAGLMHLNRADGFLWLGAAVLWFFLEWRRLKPVIRFGQIVGVAGLALLTYAAVMSPWFIRNLQMWGSLMPPGGSRTLWLTDYNQTFAYPADQLTTSHWLQSGLGAILSARLSALWLNLKTAIAIQGGVALLPLVLVGGWQKRRNLITQTGGWMWLVYLVLMTIVFPFSGGRGGFFHSGATLQALFWVLAAFGLDAAIDLGSRLRGWSKPQAWRVFSTGLVLLMVLLTIGLAGIRTTGAVDGESRWSAGYDRYQTVETWLRENSGEGAIVMVNNPPGYYVAGRRAAIVIPDGDIQTVLDVASRYGAQYLVLEEDTTAQLKDLYSNPHSIPGLKYLSEVEEAQIYQFEVGTP